MNGQSFFKALAGLRVPGGCDDCDAYQEVREEQPGITIITVRHDDTCPVYLRMTARDNS